MNRLLSFFSSSKSPKIVQNRIASPLDCSILPINNSLNQSVFIIQENNGSVNNKISNQVSDPSVKVNQMISIIRIRLIDDNPSVAAKENVLSLMSASKFQIEVQAMTSSSKIIGQSRFISYSSRQLYNQLSKCDFFNGFKPLQLSHLEDCLIEKSKKNKQQLQYYLIKGEEGEYHGQTNKYKVPFGKGVMHYLDGSIYQGMLKNRLKNGQGTLKNLDGSFYDGSWELNSKHGFGKLTDTSGNIFEGTFINNVKMGNGKLFLNNGCIIEAYWVNDLQEGHSTMKIGNNQVALYWKKGKISEVDHSKVNEEQSQDEKGFPLALIRIQINKRILNENNQKNFIIQKP